ncbi:hypothetical protein C1752_10969 [Acaryochloris thomasi RCC1774]|uniref:Uncharacterized protein n=1 Tax=Acaryochloris thomasi RCC1774 TaxID=1764569 RepID=A0A2W1J861_9CYAN|nr:hypothetical protein [Acaryochloris thomasi]PZD70540.1 hypothetical protein C1752_10969 [Acaryochloris thomasi RCC1774]
MKQDIDPSDSLKKISLYTFIAFLSISALFAIASVFTGRLGEFELKVLITTSVIAIASICSLCCSVYSSRIKNTIPSYTGIALAGSSALMLIQGVWAETGSEGYWKTTATLSIFAFASAHSLALLAVRLRVEHAWVQLVAVVNIFMFATILSATIIGEISSDGNVKFITMLAILATLETLVIPILGRLVKGNGSPVREVLSLTKRVDGAYEDKHGYIYEVKKMSGKPPGSSRS